MPPGAGSSQLDLWIQRGPDESPARCPGTRRTDAEPHAERRPRPGAVRSASKEKSHVGARTPPTSGLTGALR